MNIMIEKGKKGGGGLYPGHIKKNTFFGALQNPKKCGHLARGGGGGKAGP